MESYLNKFKYSGTIKTTKLWRLLRNIYGHPKRWWEQAALEPKEKIWKTHQVFNVQFHFTNLYTFLNTLTHICKAHRGNVIVILGYINKVMRYRYTSKSYFNLSSQFRACNSENSNPLSVNLAIKGKTCPQVQKINQHYKIRQQGHMWANLQFCTDFKFLFARPSSTANCSGDWNN